MQVPGSKLQVRLLQQLLYAEGMQEWVKVSCV